MTVAKDKFMEKRNEHLSSFEKISDLIWHGNSDSIIFGDKSGSIKIFDTNFPNKYERIFDNGSAILGITYSQINDYLAFCSYKTKVTIIHAKTGILFKNFECKTPALSIAWSNDGNFLAAGTIDGSVYIWEIETSNVNVFNNHFDYISCVGWSPDDRYIASSGDDNRLIFCDPSNGKIISKFELKTYRVYDFKWSPNGKYFAFAGNSIELVLAKFDNTDNLLSDFVTLEGHTGQIGALSFSNDSKLIASKSSDDSVIIWDVENINQVDKIQEICFRDDWPTTNISFHPQKPILATLGLNDNQIRIWDYKISNIDKGNARKTIKYTSAKIVLVGESNVGKSCLAMRLAENRYPEDSEQGTTHGMRFWRILPEQLNKGIEPQDAERRDIVLWDMGGQGEYRLVHQLFLKDTTMALLLLDPTRGVKAFDEIDEWVKRLEKQLQGRKAVKLLIGSKLDQPSDLINNSLVTKLVDKHSFQNYLETSARTGRGIEHLKNTISLNLDWDKLGKTSRPELFQHIRDEIEILRSNKEVVIQLDDLEKRVRKKVPKLFEKKSVKAVVEQLATQGVIAVTEFSSKQTILVLQVGEIERYAGSLIVAARDNIHGVPALEERSLNSKDIILPGISEEDRLPRPQEIVILKCVLQLLIEHGLCFSHEGLFIFPSLYHNFNSSASSEIGHSISLYYDFSGAIDNIYASLVAWLVISHQFGKVRLWQDRAEFECNNQGVTGLRKVDRGGGFAHLDIYFDDETPNELKDLFTCFVEDHLQRNGIEIIENIEITCECGFSFQEQTVRTRIDNALFDIGCPTCDKRSKICDGALGARDRDPKILEKTWALRTEIESKKSVISNSVKTIFKQSTTYDKEITKILHLSDLHICDDTTVDTILYPLIVDLKNHKNGLSCNELDFLIVSGDITKSGKPNEFQIAQNFISKIIDEFNLNTERCIFVPGNHDLSWDESVYNWHQKRTVDLSKIKNGHYCEQGQGFLIRDECNYKNRFKNYSQHFFHQLTQKEYPLTPEDQCLSFLYPESNLQFISFNSSWEIDEFFKKRASINICSLTKGLLKADKEIEEAVATGRIKDTNKLIRIAVLHHPVSGFDQIKDDNFIEQLHKSNIRVILHGHVHNSTIESIKNIHKDKIYTIGSGSFGSDYNYRPESIPRLYNFIEVNKNNKKVNIHTRCKPNKDGSWGGWAVWPSKNLNTKKTYYSIDL